MERRRELARRRKTELDHEEERRREAARRARSGPLGNVGPELMFLAEWDPNGASAELVRRDYAREVARALAECDSEDGLIYAALKIAAHTIANQLVRRIAVLEGLSYEDAFRQHRASIILYLVGTWGSIPHSFPGQPVYIDPETRAPTGLPLQGYLEWLGAGSRKARINQEGLLTR